MGTRSRSRVEEASVDTAADVRVLDEGVETAIVVPQEDGYTEVVLADGEAHRLAHLILAQLGPRR